MASRRSEWFCGYEVTTVAGSVLQTGHLPAGPFSIDWPYESRASISFAAPACRTFVAELLRPTTDFGAIRLLPSILYRGRLQSRAGVPAGGVLVELVGRGGSRVGRPGTTDEGGWFALETDLRELPFPSEDGTTYPDLWLLAARRDRGEACTVSARPSGFFDTHLAVVEFEQGLVIVVRRPNGDPVSDATVRLDPDTDAATSVSAIPSTFGGTTGVDGRCSVGWPPRLRQVRVRVRAHGEPEAVGFLRASDAVDKDAVMLTLPVDGNRIELSLRRAQTGAPGENDVLWLQAGWTTPGADSGEFGFESIRLEAPVPSGEEPWSVRFLDSPSLRFEQFRTSARWRARYLGSEGYPAISDGTVALRRAHANLEGEVLLASASSSAEPEDVFWLRIREDADGDVGVVESVSLSVSHGGRVGRSGFGRVTWSTPSADGASGRLIAVEGIQRPRTADVPAASADVVSGVMRSSGGGQRQFRCSLAQWAGAYDVKTPLLLELAPSGPVVRVLTRSSDGAILPNVQLLAMSVGGAIGGEHWTEEEYVTDATGGADVLVPRADADLLVLAKTADDRAMGRVLVKSGAARAEIVLTAGDLLRTTVRLFDGRTPVRGNAYLVTRPFSRWTIPCTWDAARMRFSSARPVALDLFDLRIDAEAIEQTGSSAIDRREHRYRLAVPAKDAQGKTVELPRLVPGAFDVK